MKMFNNRETFTVPSFTDPNKEYIVAYDPFKGFSCSCMGWTMKQKCRHILYIMQKYGLER